MNPGELEILIGLIHSVSAETVIEIGANSGRTAKAILRNVPSIRRYIGIDVPPNYVTQKTVQRKEVLPNPGHLALDDPRFRMMIVRRGTFDLSADDLPKADVIFIDGDHSEAAVRNDYAIARKVIRPGGVVIFHDDHGRDVVDVSRVLDDLHEQGETATHIDGTWLAFRRM